jgi:hypothetical protein
MTRIARVVTTIVQEIEISDEYTDAGKQEVLNFLAEYQGFNEFVGIANGDETMRIVAVQVLEDEVEELEQPEVL